MQSFEEHDYSDHIDMGVWKKLMRIAQPFRKHLIAILITMSRSIRHSTLCRTA